ncbi:MAG: superoxide dismutase [Oligosphaeraceae bacterium]|nr:superoxide dismutase [Oligosphaeraceae bacterium]
MNKILCLITLLALTLAASAQDGKATLQFSPLPYSYDALEPHIDARTMQVHYEKHHRGYFQNLIKAMQELPGGDQLSLEQVLGQLKGKSAALRNNAGGHFNHDFFWQSMSPQGGGEPEGLLGEKIRQSFGSWAEFQRQFKQTALSRFGSGWAWLCLGPDGGLFLCSTANQDNPLMDLAEQPGIPLLGLDVWEHAYYLKYQNLRGDYIDAFWHVVHWPTVQTRLQQALANRK